MATNEQLDQLAALLVPRLNRIADRNPDESAQVGSRRGWETRGGAHRREEPGPMATVREATDAWLRSIGIPPERVRGIAAANAGLQVIVYCGAKDKPHIQSNCPSKKVGNAPCVELVVIPWDAPSG